MIVKHPYIKKTTNGVYAIKSLRKDNGERIPFEIMKGFKLFDFNAFEESRLLSIVQLSSGYQHKNNFKHAASSTLYLHNLSVINVYDHKTEFFSSSGIDFTYIEDQYDAQLEIAQEWINDYQSIVRAQWVSIDDEASRILELVNMGYSSLRSASHRRAIDLELEL